MKPRTRRCPLRMGRDDPAGGNFERREQGRCTVPVVIVALAGQAAPRRLSLIIQPAWRKAQRPYDSHSGRIVGQAR
jgi:hypothetical protein